MRHEHMERIRRRGSEATSEGSTHPYDDASPWKWVWAEAVEDSKFWKKGFGDPAFFALTKIKEMGAVISGDAAIAGAEPRKRKADDELYRS